MRTVGEWVSHCQQALEAGGACFGHGTDNASDEAAWLVLHAIGASPSAPFEDWDRSVTTQQAGRIRALLRRRLETREPLAYLLGEAWFCGLRYEVTPDVLVPRSPIAELIAAQFSPWLAPGRLRRALDLCTGSGCIAVAMAVNMPSLEVDAADISPAALRVAAANVALHGVGDRVRLVESDGFSGLRGQAYDLIVCNPPYIPHGRLEDLPGEYRAEPEIALVSGPDGLDLPLRILLESADYLEGEGVLVMEVGESALRLETLLPSVPFTWLQFEHGGEGVFTMDRAGLSAARPVIERLMEKRANVG